MMELDGQIVQILSYEHQKIRPRERQVRPEGQEHPDPVRSSRRPRRKPARSGRASASISGIVQYLYSEGDLHYFMDKESYEQFPLSPGCSWAMPSSTTSRTAWSSKVLMYDDEAVGVDMPLNVVLEVTQTEPGYKGDTATGGNKPRQARRAGLTINVPALRVLRSVTYCCNT